MSAAHAPPTVSVVIPTHNTANFITAALDSVFAQTYQDLEVIVVDDASTDDTETRIQAYGERVLYIKQSHAGSAVARNRGVLAAQGKYIAFLDSDDLWLPTKLEKQIALAEKRPEAVLIYSDFNRTEDPGEELVSGLARRKHRQIGEEFHSLLRDNFLHTSSVLARRDALAEAGMFDPKLINAQDWDLWIRLADVGPFAFVDEILTHYRLHPSQTVKTLRFARNLVYADELMLARWSRDPIARPLVRTKLGEDLWMLGRREWKNGNFPEARSAYWRCARLGAQRWQSVARALVCSLPKPLLQVVRPAGGQIAT